jgi:hypothetical protein
MMAIALVPFSIQGLAILLDEAVFHRRRGLPRWERIGHPIDTFLQLGCMLIPLFFALNRAHLIFFSVAAFFSTLLITKDERVHALHCEWRENWLHALLFIVHPVVLIATAYLWASPGEHGWFYPVLRLQILLMAGFGTYQIIYWCVWERLWRKNSK